jgi:hypothetical protein
MRRGCTTPAVSPGPASRLKQKLFTREREIPETDGGSASPPFPVDLTAEEQANLFHLSNRRPYTIANRSPGLYRRSWNAG